MKIETRFSTGDKVWVDKGYLCYYDIIDDNGVVRGCNLVQELIDNIIFSVKRNSHRKISYLIPGAGCNAWYKEKEVFINFHDAKLFHEEKYRKLLLETIKNSKRILSKIINNQNTKPYQIKFIQDRIEKLTSKLNTIV